MNTITNIDHQILYARILEAYQGCVSTKNSALQTLEEFKSVFESIFTQALIGELRSFSSIYSRIIYCCDKFDFEPELRKQIVSFRAQSARYSSEQITTSGFITNQLSRLCRIVNKVSKGEVPSSLLPLMSDDSEQNQANFSKRDKIKLISGIVDRVSDIRESQQGICYTVELFVESVNDGHTPWEKVNITVFETYGQVKRMDLIQMHCLLKKYLNVNIFDCLANSQNDNLCSTANTMIVIEPDYLVDVTDIAACFSQEGANENMFLLNKLMPATDSEAMFKGSLINDLLDAHLRHQDDNLENVFRRSLSKNLLKGARYGGAVIKNIWDSVLSEHLTNISLFAQSIKNERAVIEPSFISASYGIQGRLDVMTEDAKDLNIKNIYELKSGRAPALGGLWRANQIQVACYNMLLESSYGEKRRGTSALFYSSDKGDPIRNFLSSTSDKIEICCLRNKLIDIIYRLGEGDFSPLDSLTANCFGDAPPFKQKDIADFEHFYRSLSQLEKSYYQHFVSFTVREMLIAKTAALSSQRLENYSKNGYAALWKDSVEQKEKDFSIIHSLHFKGISPQTNQIILSIGQPIDHNFRINDSAVLYPFDRTRTSVLRNQIIKGTISYIDAHSIHLSPRNELIDHRIFEQNTLWAVEHDMMEKSYWANIASLFLFLSHPSKAREIVFSRAQPDSQKSDYKNIPTLSDNQNESIRKALSARDFFLLQGPPGTGKTSTAIMSIIHNILSTTDKHITILAFTNRAVDEIAQKLRERKVDFLRLSHSTAAQDDNTISSLWEKGKMDTLRAKIKAKRVIISTVSSFYTRIDDLKEIVRFDELIVDEASQLTHIQVVGILPYFKKFILVGDQNQLPSVVAQSEEFSTVKDPKLIDIGMTDMRDSLFECLYDNCVKNGYTDHYAMLDTHFRMHRDIARLVNPFYGNRLKEGRDQQLETRKEPRVWIIPSSFEPTAKKHTGEAETAARIIKKIREQYGENFSENTVGVVTPFRAQIVAIKNAIADTELLEKVTIDTVERFQGGEKDIIIVSTAVFSTSQISSIQSLNKDRSVDRKLNVTISRAREELIFLGYLPVLEQAPFYDKIIKNNIKYENF